MTDVEEIMLQKAKERLQVWKKTLKDLDEKMKDAVRNFDKKAQGKLYSARNEAKMEIEEAKKDIRHWEDEAKKKADEQNNATVDINWNEYYDLGDILDIPDVENNVAWYALGQRLSRQFKNQKSKMSTALADAYIKYKPKKSVRDQITSIYPNITIHDVKTLQPKIDELENVNYAEEHIVTFSDKNNFFNRMRVNANFLTLYDSDEDDDLTYDEGFAERARVINMFLDLLPEKYTNGSKIEDDEDDEVYKATKDSKIDYETLSADSEWNWMFYLVALVFIGKLNQGAVVKKETFFDDFLKVIGVKKLSEKERKENEERKENKRKIKQKIDIEVTKSIYDPIVFKKNKKKKPAVFYRALLAYKKDENQMEVDDAPELPGISTFALLLVLPQSTVLPQSREYIFVIIKYNSEEKTVDIQEVVKRPVVTK